MKFIKNGKTTLSGIASLLVGLFQMYGGDIASGSAAVVSGLGLVFASDVS